jgi:hypothetical protein
MLRAMPLNFDLNDVNAEVYIMKVCVLGVSRVPQLFSATLRYVPRAPSIWKARPDPLQAFEDMDVDGGGTLDAEEIYEGLMKLGMDINRSAIDDLIAEFDDNGNGELEFSEWREVVQLSTLPSCL